MLYFYRLTGANKTSKKYSIKILLITNLRVYGLGAGAKSFGP